MKFTTNIQRLYIDAQAHERLFHWVDIAKGEVSSLGLVEQDKDGDFIISEIFLVKQTCTSASTDMDQPDIAKLLYDLEKQGKAEMLKCWIHSHGSMNVFWSSTDEATIKGLANDNFFISVVVNKNRDMLGRIDVFFPVRLMIDALEVHVLIPLFGLLDECKKEFTEKVKEDAGILMLTKDGKPDDLRDIWDPLFPDIPDDRFDDNYEHDLFVIEQMRNNGEITEQEYREYLDDINLHKQVQGGDEEHERDIETARF
jgi:proteasome lid subunit RPN8/RPN11